MFELIAECSERKQRWQQVLVVGRTYVLGREGNLELSVPWDQAISRRHVSVTANNRQVRVERLDGASKVISWNGASTDANDSEPLRTCWNLKKLTTILVL